MKTIKKQLAAAIAMFLVATIALGSSTYAWFVSNTNVTATAGTIAAQSNSVVLQIKGDGEGAAYNTSAANNFTKALSPSTSSDGETFGKLAAGVNVASADSYAATWRGTAGAFQAADLVTITGDDTAKYVYTSKYYLRTATTGTTATNVYLSDFSFTAPAAQGAKDIYKALRAAVICGDNVYFFAPTGYSLSTEKAGTFTDAWALGGEPTITTTFSTGDTPISASVGYVADAEDGVEVSVVFWYEGQDNNCKTAALDANTVSVSLAFATDSTVTG